MSSNNHISQHQKVTGLLGEKMELPMVTVVSIVQDRARSREIARDRERFDLAADPRLVDGASALRIAEICPRYGRE